MDSAAPIPTGLDASLSVRMLPYIDRAMLPFARKYPSLVDDLRSRAQLDLVQAEPKAKAAENPVGYMLLVITNAFRQVERSHLRERRRSRTRSLEALVGTSILPRDLAPDPQLVAMAREAIAIRDRRRAAPRGPHALQARERDLFMSIVRDHPGWRNRQIAEEINRETGRKFNVYSVWRYRRRLGI